MTRDIIRQKMREKRLALSNAARAEAAASATQYLLKSDFFQKANHIACYIAFGSELETSDLVEAIMASNKKCYMPILHSEKKLNFVLYTPGDPLEKNTCGVLQPRCREIFSLSQLDLVMMPLVAFDATGTRLGCGVGYYDRTFADAKMRPFLCGFAYSFQEVPELSRAAWDVPMNAIVTEKTLVTFQAYF